MILIPAESYNINTEIEKTMKKLKELRDEYTELTKKSIWVCPVCESMNITGKLTLYEMCNWNEPDNHYGMGNWYFDHYELECPTCNNRSVVEIPFDWIKNQFNDVSDNKL